MKFICLGCAAENEWQSRSKSEQDALVEQSFVYDDELLKQGNWLDGGQALQSAQSAKTLRWQNGRVLVTDGPFVETKEQIGGFGVLEARDMDHAVELMSKHPGIRLGPFEIRPVDEESLKRQTAAARKPGGDRESARSLSTKTTNFTCLGYIDHEKGASMSKDEFAAMMQDVIAFDQARQKNGQWISGVALQGCRNCEDPAFEGGPGARYRWSLHRNEGAPG